MTDKEKFRKEVEKLKSNLIHGACSSQIAMETRCKEEAYNEVLAILDTMQEGPKKKCMYSNGNYTNGDRQVLCDGCEELCKYNSKTAAESLDISQGEYDKIVDRCIYGKEPELVDADDLLKEEPVSEDLEKIVEEIAEPTILNAYGTKELARRLLNTIYGTSISDDLGEYINELSKQFPEVSFAKLSRIAVRVAKWQKEQINEVLLSEVLPCFMHGGEADEVVAKLDEVLNKK